MSISVIMPARDAARNLRLAVRSTLLALGSSDELLVGVHASKDNTEALLREIEDPRLKIFIFPGGEFSEVLNGLISSSKGQFIARMDSDDVCLPWRFVIQRRLLRRNPDKFFCSSAMVFKVGDGLPFFLPQYFFRFDTPEIRKLLVHSNPINHPTFIGGRGILVSLGGYRNTAGEDLDLWLRALLAGIEFQRSRLPLIIYRLSANQLSRTSSYRSGWEKSKEISTLRRILDSENETVSASQGIWTKTKLTLQLAGFPTPGRIRYAVTTLAKSGEIEPNHSS